MPSFTPEPCRSISRWYETNIWTIGFASASDSLDQVGSGVVVIHVDAAYQEILPLKEMEGLDACQPVGLGRCSAEPPGSRNTVVGGAEIADQYPGTSGDCWLLYSSLSSFGVYP